jgi:DNA primase
VGISEQKLLNLLQKVLGNGKIVSKDEAMFMCPFSHHRKPKLAINLSTQRWQSWIDTNSKGRSIYGLFKKMNVAPQYLTELSRIVKIPKSTQQTEEEQVKIHLPYEFTSLQYDNEKTRASKSAFNYLRQRNIFSYDIERYNIGYCESGDYANRIIIPSYDCDNNLNYFIARDFTGTAYLRYKNPPVSKDVVVFENQIDFSEPLIFCEGVFDAMAIRRNAIPLLGKNIPSKLKTKLVEHGVSEVCIVLDNDAFKNALQISETLMSESIKVRLVKMGNEDAADIGFNKIIHKIRNAEFLDFSELMKQKLCMN